MTEYRIVDVFTDRPLAGNALAVVLGDQLDTEVMQAVARETNLSETTFIGQRDEFGRWPVRIFTPVSELPFAGHPALGSAWVIREHLDAERPDRVTLRLGIGEVPVHFDSDGVGWITPPESEMGPVLDPERLLELLGLERDDLDGEHPVQEIRIGITFSFIPLRSLEAVKRARYHTDLAAELSDEGIWPDVFFFSRETELPDNHVHARMLAPLSGVPEDPATGSANACLAAWINAHDYLPGVEEVRVEQGFEMKRPSLLRLRLRPEVQVGGGVVEVAHGRFSGL